MGFSNRDFSTRRYFPSNLQLNSDFFAKHQKAVAAASYLSELLQLYDTARLRSLPTSPLTGNASAVSVDDGRREGVD
jgi:hypothetical protein